MAKQDKLITYAYLKEECDIPNNIPDEELEGKIYQAQETLRMLMSDRFYQDFKTAYVNKTMSPVYNSLYNPYIKQYVAWQANEFWIIKANFKPTRGGFRVHTEENSVIATDIQMATIIKDAKQKSQYYKELFIQFMDNHITDYPLHNRCNDSKLSGNSFRITAVKNKHRRNSLTGHDPNCRCRNCYDQY